MMKRIILACLCLCLFASNNVVARAEHMNGSNSNLPCTNTYVYWRGNGVKGTYTGSHNYTCTVTYYIYAHYKECTSCGAILGNGPTYKCTERHTCGTVIYDCSGAHPE